VKEDGMKQDGNDYFLTDEEFRNGLGEQVWKTAPIGARMFVDSPEGVLPDGRPVVNPVTFVFEREADGWVTQQ
jgi:hypothetical protein